MEYSAVTNVVEKVRNLLISEHSFISAAQYELRLLEEDLSLLNAMFEDMSSGWGKENEVLREGQRQMMELAYNVEDTIDYSLARAPEFTKLSSRAFPKICKSLRENTVRPMIDKYRELFRYRSGIDVDDRIEIKRKLPPLIKQENVIGLEDEEKKLIGYLRERTKELDVISILGMAGIGKTTLAWKIYTNEETCYEFPFRIWVYASQKFNRRNVFLKILKHFISLEDISELRDEDLSHKVSGYLKEKRFLLVIDDVCSFDSLNAIQCVLPKTNCNGKVLITSRYTNVSILANRTREPLRLGFLTKEQSWELLQYQVFGSLRDCPQEIMMGISEYIAKQCDGLPLAIMHAGRILVDMLSSRKEMTETIGEWNTVFENLQFLKYEMEQGAAFDIVASSYNVLPHYLRDCFLYLGVFPENSEIPVWTLINLWIAEGFIHQKREYFSLEESAEEILMELVDRHLVMVAKTNPIGEVKTCRVHAVIHAFCRSKAGITERNLFQEIKTSKRGIFEPPISDVVQTYYRVCIRSDILEQFLSKKPRSKNLRSLLCFYEKPVVLDSERISDIADAFCMLRVLATNSVKFTQFPRGVTRLIHLSHISLCGDDLEIPDEISKLLNLRTIVVDTKSVSLTIKANIWRLSLLRHVKTKAAIVLDIQGREGNAGKDLQTLSRLSPQSCTMAVFSRARNLRKLGIRGQLATLDAKCLRELHCLEKLKLMNDSILSDKTSRNESHGLPHSALDYFRDLVNLKILTLSATHLNWEHMSTLGKIDTLEILKLKNYAFTGESWNSSVDAGFRRLEFLLIASTDLALWESSTDDFPSLRYLVLKNCEKLRKIPMGIAKSLKKLDMENLPITAVKSAKEIEKEKTSGFKLSIIGPGSKRSSPSDLHN